MRAHVRTVDSKKTLELYFENQINLKTTGYHGTEKEAAYNDVMLGLDPFRCYYKKAKHSSG